VRSFAVAAALALVLTASAASAAPRCAHETFPIDGKPLLVTICPAAHDAAAKTVALTETYRSGTASFSRTSEVPLLDDAASSRLAEDVSLAPLGSARTLHLALAYRDDTVTVDAALLLPGAIPLK
jgi:hypothetical protein